MKTMKQIGWVLALFAVGLAARPATAQPVVYAADFGVQAGSFRNASPAIRAAMEACAGKPGVTLKLPEGRIDLWPDGASKKELYISNSTENDTLSKVKNIAFLIEGMDGVTIEGNHTTVVLHGKMVSFALLNSTNINLKNISFDYERPTMSELTLLSVSDSLVRARIHRDSRYRIDGGGRIGFYGEGWQANAFHTIRLTPETESMRYSSFVPFLKARATDEGCNEVAFRGRFDPENYRAGDVLTIRDPYRDNAGGFISLSKNVRIEQVNMRYMHGLGVVSQFSENLSFVGVEVAPDPASGRVVAAFADCFHFSGCKGQITLDGCHTSGSHDDPVNVHGTHLKITAIDGNRLTVRFMHHQTYGFDAFFAGDSVAFTQHETLLNYAFAKLKSARMLTKREMELELEGNLPATVRTGDCLENLTHNPDVTIRNCRFERTNTRGVLMTTRGKVLIENNEFIGTGMHAIYIADDAESWYESGPVRDVTIRNNTFTGCAYNQAPGSYVISIAPENHLVDAQKPVHRNIRIEANRFELAGKAVLTAKSTENLVFSGNRIRHTGAEGTADADQPAFDLNGCSKVDIRGNQSDKDLSIQIEQMKKGQVKTDIRFNRNETTISY